MIKSMTGYGRGKFSNGGREYTVEIKSVNSKYSDINIRIPRQLSYLEDKSKRLIGESVSRGKIDVFISFENCSTLGRQVKIDKPLAEAYIKELKNIAAENHIIDDVSAAMLLRIPEVLKVAEDNEEEETIWEELKKAIKEATLGFITMRILEGEKLKEDIIMRLNAIADKLSKIEDYSSNIVEDYIKKLEERIKELTKTDVVDQTRLSQEIVIYSDKCSIEEELTRFKSHISQFMETLEFDERIGKRLYFLIQEMNREINTIGSKANNLEITKQVVEIKTEIENIREQVQNIE